MLCAVNKIKWFLTWTRNHWLSSFLFFCSLVTYQKKKKNHESELENLILTMYLETFGLCGICLVSLIIRFSNILFSSPSPLPLSFHLKFSFLMDVQISPATDCGRPALISLNSIMEGLGGFLILILIYLRLTASSDNGTSFNGYIAMMCILFINPITYILW